MILTESEIFLLTGKKRSSAQIQALNAMGIEHKLRPDSSVVVSRLHLEQILGVIVPNNTPKQFEPDWTSVNA